ncbi:MAG: P-II family nitrogen regulator [Cyclobacteriaceae bacterium]|nr:P-II family nitrogen regulator [Cyclobacteriaceae bacterium]
MKMIMAVIRIDKVNETREALSEAGMPSYFATGQVYGRGKGKWDAKIMEGARNDLPEAISKLGPEPALRPHRLITLVVKASRVKDAVNAIIKSNRTEKPGDGKIFVLPMTDATRVRTREVGEGVLD